MGKKILWISRHSPFGVARQITRLREMFGADCEVVHRDIGNAAAVAAEYRRGGYADMVCVVPLATLDHICREGLNPLWAEMAETPTSDGRVPDLVFGAKRFWFAGFKRVRGLSLDLQPVEPRGGVQHVLRITRHVASAGELTALRTAFGQSVEVVDDDRQLRDGRDVGDRMHQAGAQEALVVAPYGVYDQLVKSGLHPLYTKMEQGQFVSLHRIMGVRLQLEEL